MGTPSNVKDFLISYTGVDVDWAIWIAEQLEAAGYTTIYQARDFTAGSNFVVDMDQAMRQTKRTIAVLSPEYLAARFTLPEWAEAFRRDPTGEYALLVPVVVKPCALGGLLAARVYIDLSGKDKGAASTLLVERLQSVVSKPLPPLPATLSPAGPPAPERVIAPLGLPRAVSLIGREAVLAELMAKLRAGDTIGVFALEGMGGVGKTALAAEVTARLAEEQSVFPGGAAWIACEGLEGETGQAEVWARVARALGLEHVASLPDPQARRAALAKALAQQPRLLLALDNLEPSLDADVILDTLSTRGHTALLLTARQKVAPLRLLAVEVPPLPSPDGASLFKERISQIDPARLLTQDEPALPKLLMAIGGLPLAIELTAAYAGMQRLSLERVLREVEKDGLNAAAFRVDPKKALLVRFERSWKVLLPRQQECFAGLSLLAKGGFPRAAALAVAEASGDEPDPSGDLLTLVSYALAEALPGGERQRLHPLLREYAAEKFKKFPSEKQARLGDAMLAHWLEYAKAHPGYEGMDALEAETAGLMGALGWAHKQERDRDLLGLAHAIRPYLFVRGHADEDRLASSWAVEAAQALRDKEEERWAAHELAELERRTGRLAESRAGYERALDLARQLGDLAAEQYEVHGLARIASDQGRLKEARVGYERALELAKQLGNTAAERHTIFDLAVLDEKQGRLVEAGAHYRDALQLAQQLGDKAAQASAFRNLGYFIGQHGEPEQGREMLSEALAIDERLGRTHHMGKDHWYLALLERDGANRRGAIAHFREALRCLEQVQSPVAEEVRADLLAIEKN